MPELCVKTFLLLRAACRVQEVVQRASDILSPVTHNPRLESELLLSHILQRPRTFLLAHPEAQLTAERASDYAGLVARRATGEPLPYITGHSAFFGLEFTVTPDVLIPRPETELLVEQALARLKGRTAPLVADIGTGSGCIAVSVARHCPDARCYAVDISAVALAVARANAARHGVADRITWLEGDLLTPLPEPVDVILSNPPYVAETEWASLPLSVRHEPRAALLSGVDGLDALRTLLKQAPPCLRPGGALFVEIGERQGDAAQVLAQAAFPTARVQILPDLAGKVRLLKVATITN